MEYYLTAQRQFFIIHHISHIDEYIDMIIFG